MRRNRIAALVVCGLVMSTVGCSDGSSMDERSATSAEVSAGGGDANADALKDRLVGTWELSAVERRDADGVLLPAPEPPAFGSPNPTGLLIYDAAGYVGLAIMQSGRPNYDQPTPEEAMADLEGYSAVFGTYAVNQGESTVTAHVQGARDPRLTGTDQTSGVELVGDRLTLTRPASADGVHHALVWERVPDLAAPTPTHQRVSAFWTHVPNDGATADEPPLRPGYIIYTSAGRMMVHLVQPDRATYEASEPTPEEAQAAVTSYMSYFGPYSVNEDGHYLVHHRVGHTIDLTDRPMEERRTGVDTDGQRFYEFVGNRIVLRTLSTVGVKPHPAPGELARGGMITWERLGPGS